VTDVLVSDPEIMNVVYDTEEAIPLASGPPAEIVAQAMITIQSWHFWAIEEFTSADQRVFHLEFVKVEPHPEFEGAWFIWAILPSDREVVVFYTPNQPNPGYLWLNVNPKQLSFRREGSLRPALGL
jgi:hypothetical protein